MKKEKNIPAKIEDPIDERIQIDMINISELQPSKSTGEIFGMCIICQKPSSSFISFSFTNLEGVQPCCSETCRWQFAYINLNRIQKKMYEELVTMQQEINEKTRGFITLGKYRENIMQYLIHKKHFQPFIKAKKEGTKNE